MQKIYDTIAKKDSGQINRFEIYSTLTEVLQSGLELLGKESKQGIFDILCLAHRLLSGIDSCVTDVYTDITTTLVELDDKKEYDKFDHCYKTLFNLVEMAIEVDIKVTSESSQA